MGLAVPCMNWPQKAHAFVSQGGPRWFYSYKQLQSRLWSEEHEREECRDGDPKSGPLLARG